MHALISLFAENWHLFRLYFVSEERFYARIMFFVLIIMELMTIGLDVLLTYWSKNFLNALQNYDQSAFFHSLLQFCFLAATIIIISVHKTYLSQTLLLYWRRWMTNDFLKRYLDHHAYYEMSFMKNNRQNIQDRNDNPDQRISSDISIYIISIFELTIGLLSTCVSLVCYVILLWSLSGVIKINFTQNLSCSVRGIMVWAALIYAGLGTIITNLIGRVLFHLKYEQEHCEANFRYGLVRLRDHAESIAFYRSESNEQTSLSTLYLELITNFRRIIHRKLALNWFDSFYTTTARVFPYLVASHRYFSKQITFGHLEQIATAFSSVHSALSFIPNSYETIVQWRSATKRLTEFEYTLNELQLAKQNSKIKFIYVSNEQSTHIENLTIQLPLKIGENDGQILIKHLNLVLEPHQAVLITGKTGSGKSTFLRTLAGIWPHGSGMITFPLGDTVAFVPQKAYCPLGSLRHCLTYPSISFSSIEEDKKIRNILNLCQMKYWSNNLDEVQDWSRVLSLGEQQKMAFIRILYLRPKWLFLDEVTSSLDEQAETYLYSILMQELANHSTIISIGHRNNLRQFHQLELVLNDGNVTMMSI
ncbi:unnamed protein product [Adineta steineri]|uniref:Uncharacterized protein n=1 Tax=Adineta steineri TaxID=433720 RepID=A0A816CLP8_9BILA|nr:unnamed protein product [Adineta steineri]CAF1625081.1 unnamed protein product [Adineta steineri]